LLGRRVGDVVEVKALAERKWLEVKAILRGHEPAKIAA
jgi:transcription elongation GreA/GreB family factor